VGEAMLAYVLADAILEKFGNDNWVEIKKRVMDYIEYTKTEYRCVILRYIYYIHDFIFIWRIKMSRFIYAFLFLMTLSFSYAQSEFKFPKGEYKQLVGKEFLDFRMIDERGKVVHLKDFIKKGKPVVIVFWAIGDAPGTFEFLPEFNKLYKKYKDKVNFLAVLLSRSTAKEVKEAKEEIPLDIPVYLAYREAIERYKIAKIDVPYIVLIKPDGVIKRIMIRPESYTRYEEPEQPLTSKKVRSEIIAESIEKLDSYIRELIGE